MLRRDNYIMWYNIVDYSILGRGGEILQSKLPWNGDDKPLPFSPEDQTHSSVLGHSNSRFVFLIKNGYTHMPLKRTTSMTFSDPGQLRAITSYRSYQVRKVPRNIRCTTYCCTWQQYYYGTGTKTINTVSKRISRVASSWCHHND